MLESLVPASASLVGSFLSQDLLKLIHLEFKGADIINFGNIIIYNVDDHMGENEPIAIVQPRETSKSPTIVISCQEAHQLKPSPIQLSCGSHFIINKACWWDKPEPFTIGRLKIIPIQTRKPRAIGTFEKKPPRKEFEVCVHSEDLMTIEIWKNDRTQQEISFHSSSVVEIPRIQGSQWSFTKYQANQTIKFEDLPEIVVSFDENIVSQAILIAREHNVRKDEYYILVSRV